MSATLIVGVGYLGRRLVERIDAARGITRNDFDLDRDEPFTIELPRDYTLVYTVPPARNSPSDRRLERLLSRLDPAPRRFVYISTTGVYGNHDGATVDEDTAVNPGSDHAARRVVAESTLRDWSGGRGCTAVVLRVPGIYGPGRLGVERIRERAPILREQDTGPGNRIHVDDLAACCIAALADDVPAGIYNVGDGDHRTSTWFSFEVARQLGLPPPPTVTMVEAEQQFSPMRLSFLRDKRRVDTSKMRNVLGVRPAFPDAASGIRASLEAEGPDPRGIGP